MILRHPKQLAHNTEIIQDEIVSVIIKNFTTSVEFQYKFTSRIVMNVNDPSAGSPTETLLRLLLPLGD